MDRIREKRLTRKAQAAGLLLVKSPWRERRRQGYTGYELVDAARHTLVVADPDSACALSLDEVEDYLIEMSQACDRLSASQERRR